MNIKPIKTEKDYQKALKRLEIIFDAHPGTKEGDELEILGFLIEKYENEHSVLLSVYFCQQYFFVVKS